MIAFKKVKNCPNMASNLPQEFILEYADTSLFPEGFHTSEDGYEFLPEDEFKIEYDLNNQRLQEFRIQKQAMEAADNLIKSQENQIKRAEEQALKAEFEAFKAWKASQV